MSQSRHDKTFLTTGPFHVADVNQNGDDNNRIVITLTNPTDKKLKASVKIQTYTEEPFSIILPAEISLSKKTLHDFGEVKVYPNSTKRLEVDLPSLKRSVLRVVSKGDYEVEDGRPASGKLEISSVVGNGNFIFFDKAAPGLNSADAATFFAFADFIARSED